MKTKILIFFFILFTTGLSAKDLYQNLNIDLYGGFGGKKINGTSFENSRGYLNFYGAVRLGYKLSKSFQVETGYSNNLFGSYEYWDIDNERYMGNSYRARYHNLPILFRFRPYKSLWIGAGTQYSILQKGKLYPSYNEKEFTDISSTMNPGVWNTYFDVLLSYQRVGLGMSYTRSFTPVLKENNNWGLSSFNVYIIVDISQMLRYQLRKKQ